jgi:hypothetical protein
MNYEWDEEKRLANLAKHGLDFLDAPLVFQRCVVFRSDRGEEPRWKATGMLLQRLVTVIFTLRRTQVRVISFRGARDNEKRAYRQVYGEGA